VCNGELGVQSLSYCSTSPLHNLQQVNELKIQNDDFGGIEMKKSSSSIFNFPKITILFALISKNLTKMIRNYTGLFFIFVLPAIQTVLYCVAIGNDPKSLPIGVVNYEVFDNFTPNENCPFQSGCDLNNLSCRLTDYFRNATTFDVRYYVNEESAFQDTKNTKIWGYVSFHKNYSKALFNQILSPIKSNDETRRQSTTQVNDKNHEEFVKIFIINLINHPRSKIYYKKHYKFFNWDDETSI
jgi:hypothetical protein